MSLKLRRKIKYRQRLKHHKRRLRLLKKGLDPNKYYYGKYFIAKPK